MSYCINPNCQKRQNLDHLDRCLACGSSLIINERYQLVRPLRQLEGRHPTEIFEVDNLGTLKVMKVLISNRCRLVELFQREAQVLQRLKHVGIPKVDTYFIFSPSKGTKELHCLVMEKILGQNLEQWLEEHGPIPEAQAINWLRQLVHILARVHQEQLLHQNIKPSNIMLRSNGQLVLIDFGSVRELTDTYIEKLTECDVTRIYSPGYTAPEQINGQVVAESEFFALGRTLVHLLTGIYPDDLPKDPQTNQIIWRDSAPQVSPLLTDLMDELMAPLPQNRLRNPQAILDRLAAAKSFEQAAPQSLGSYAAVPEAEKNILGTLINNRYQIQRVLRRGSFGQIYLALDSERFGALCVVKEFVLSNRTENTAERLRALIQSEAKALCQINHPQLPKFLAYFAQMGRLFIVQEYIDGKSYAKLLQERHQQGQLFSEAEIIQWLKDMLPVLTYLHDHNLVHRGIYPDNVILPHGQSRPVLIDFGLDKQTITPIWAFKSDISNGSNQSFVEKLGYVPPEQSRMRQYYPYSDLYALGATAVVLLTGKEPHLLIDRETLEWQWHSYVKVSNQFRRVLDKMLAEKPKERYQSAQNVLADLQAPALPEVIAASAPLLEPHLEIDQAKKNRQVAEIAETDYFQQLQRQAEELRNSIEIESPAQLEVEVPKASTLIGEITESLPSCAVNPKMQLKAAKLPKLNPVFVDHCWQEFARHVGPIAKYILDKTLAEHPDISPVQLVEALAAEISNSQQAQEFKNSVKTNLTTRPEPVVTTSKIQPEATTSPKLNSAFVDRCRQEFARRVGPIAKYILEEKLAQYPDISPVQLVEALAAEILNPQQAMEFRQGLLVLSN